MKYNRIPAPVVDKNAMPHYNPNALLKQDEGVTHLQVRSVCGRKFGRFGVKYDHEPVIHPVTDFDELQIHELMGPHLIGTLQVEQLTLDEAAADALIDDEPEPEPPPAPVKRKRGRPRKVHVPTHEDTD